MPLFGNQMVLGVKAQRAVILRTIKVDVERIPKRSKRIAFLRIAAVVRCTRSWIIAEHCHTLQVMSWYLNIIQQGVRVATQCASAPASWQYLRIYSPGGACSDMLAIWDISNKLTFDLLTLKVVSESHVTWATSVPILVLLGLSVLKLGPMYATDTDVRQKHRLMLLPYGVEKCIIHSITNAIEAVIKQQTCLTALIQVKQGELGPQMYNFSQ